MRGSWGREYSVQPRVQCLFLEVNNITSFHLFFLDWQRRGLNILHHLNREAIENHWTWREKRVARVSGLEIHISEDWPIWKQPQCSLYSVNTVDCLLGEPHNISSRFYKSTSVSQQSTMKIQRGMLLRGVSVVLPPSPLSPAITHHANTQRSI